MALSTKGVSLKYGTTTPTTVINIKSFPEIFGRMMTAETTTMSDAAQTFIETIRETQDILEFNANYDKTLFATLSALTAEQHCALEFPDGSKITWTGSLSASISAGEVAGVIEMTVLSVPHTVPQFVPGT